MSEAHKASYRPVTWVDRLRTPLMWAVGLAWMLPVAAAMMVLSLVWHPDRTQWFDRLYCRVQVWLTGSRWRAVVHPDIRPDRQYLFVQNHVNVLDHVTMYNATSHFKQGVELESHFRIPFYGWMMRRRGTIGIRRGEGNRDELIASFRSEIARGHSILAFPEGTRTRDGGVGRMRRGTFYLARELGIPIVPTTVVGMYDVLRTGSWIFRPGDITVFCDAPIETADLPREEIPDLAERVKAIQTAHLEEHARARRS